MKLARSSYYYRLRKRKDDADLRDRLEQLALEFSRYGYRRMTHALRREGWKVNEKRVLRVMRESDLCCAAKRKFVKTTNSAHGYPRYPNRLKGLTLTGINQAWVTDITYIRILTGFVYLAAILDKYSRKVIGYAIREHIDTALTLEALQMAIEKRKPVAGVIHHSDQGVQYAALDYMAMLEAHGLIVSMSRTGNPYDNATAESFFKTLKAEEVYLWEYETLADVVKRVSYFIEAVYNKKRLHSALGYLPPEEFEENLVQKKEKEAA